MSAQPVIDPVEQSVRLDGSVWPFDWDPSEATIVIAFGDVSYELNVISWRQKRNLARVLSRAAAVPLERMLLGASLRRRTPLPVRTEERSALVALCLWLNESPSALPWNPAALAQATIEICRNSALAPRDLDELPAVEVEELWQAVAAQATTVPHDTRRIERLSPPPQAGFKRIVVIPDPPPAAGAGVEASSAPPDHRHSSIDFDPPRSTAETLPATDRPLAPVPPGPDAVAAPVESGPDADEPRPERTLERSPSAAAAIASRRSRQFRVRVIDVSRDARPRHPVGLQRDPRAHPDHHVAPPAPAIASASAPHSMEAHQSLAATISRQAAPLTQDGASSRPSPGLAATQLSPLLARAARPVEMSPPREAYPTDEVAAATRLPRATTSDLLAAARPVRRTQREDAWIGFIEDPLLESAADRRGDDGRAFEDELSRAAVEAGIDEA